jgi:septal ring factor EnvC (AmiA/AmiB activator)
MKFEEYASGVDREPLRFELRPETRQDGPVKVASFAPKEAAVAVVSASRRQEDQDEINDLNKKIAELQEELRQARQEATQLREEVESLTQTNENMVTAKQSLEHQLHQAQEQIAQLSS